MTAHLNPMTTTRKPALPHAAHIEIASKVFAAISDAPIAVVESLPAKVRESLDYFREVTEVAERISTQQPEVLAEYRQDILDNMDAAGPETEAMVDALLSSHVMARILADVAAGSVEPIAMTTKTAAAKPAARKTAPKKKAPVEPEPTPTPTPTPAPVPLDAGESDPFLDTNLEVGDVITNAAGDPVTVLSVTTAEPTPLADPTGPYDDF